MLIAAGGYAFWVLATARSVPITNALLIDAPIFAIPFFALGARVEADGDWSSPRRRGTLITLVVLAVVAAGMWQVLAITGWIIAPVVGIAVWFIAGPPERPTIVRGRWRIR
jgi:hypothetical protein